MKTLILVLICVGYLYPQAGNTIPRKVDSLFTKTSHILNIKEFGAVGDGVADDTDALQDAFDYCENNPGTVIKFNPGDIHKITRTLFYQGNTGSNFVWQCESEKPRGSNSNTILTWYGNPMGTMMVLLAPNETVIDGFTIGASVYGDSTADGSLKTGIHLLATNYDTTNVVNITSFTLTNNVATIVCDAPHKFRDSVGIYAMTVKGVAELSGLSDPQYDGKYIVKSIVDENTFTIDWYGADDTATGGTCTKIKSSGSSHPIIRNTTISWCYGYRSSGIEIGRTYPLTEQPSEVELYNVTTYGAADDDGVYLTWAGVLVSQSGNTKNFNFQKMSGAYLDYGFYLLSNASVYMSDLNYNTVYTAVIHTADAILEIHNARVENAENGMFLTGSTLNGITMIQGSNINIGREDGAMIYYNGSLVLIGNEFYNNYVFDSSWVKIITGSPLSTSGNTPSQIISIGNNYKNADGFIPIYNGTPETPNRIINDGNDYLGNQGLSIFSFGDFAYQYWHGAPNVYPLRPFSSFGQIRSFADSVATYGFLRLGILDTIGWRNYAGNGNLYLHPDTTDKIVIGGEDGISVSKIDITNLPTDTTGLTGGSIYGESPEGYLRFAIPKNLVSNGDFSSWGNYGTFDFPSDWQSAPDTAHAYFENINNALQIVNDGAVSFTGETNSDTAIVGEVYGYSFDIVSGSGDSTSLQICGQGSYAGWDTPPAGHYSGEVTATYRELFSFQNYGVSDLVIDNIRVWKKYGSLQEPPTYSKNEFHPILNPAIDDTMDFNFYDDSTTVDSIHYKVDDSLCVNWTFGANGYETTMITTPDTLTGEGTITVLNNAGISARNELQMYFIYVGDSATNAWFKIYRRE